MGTWHSPRIQMGPDQEMKLHLIKGPLHYTPKLALSQTQGIYWAMQLIPSYFWLFNAFKNYCSLVFPALHL